jgi:glucuronate isomerase
MQSSFITDNFLLHNDVAIKLYHDVAKVQPIYDYHSHLSPKDIAEDRQFDNITQLWIEGDHYKYRAMRANGVPEKYITGDATPYEKFLKYAETIPYTLRNPLYHWTHLELQRYFNINKLLNAESARAIFDQCNALLSKPEFRVRGLLKKMNVKMIGTTDDPTDDLHYHAKLKKEGFEIAVLPTFRPDKATEIEKGLDFINWIRKLEAVVGFEIKSFQRLISALQIRHNYFHKMGCRISDHGHNSFYDAFSTEEEINIIFSKALAADTLDKNEIEKYKAAILHKIAVMNHEKGWVQQFHVGAIRNNNSKMMNQIGPDQGFDSIGDLNMAENMSRFFDKLNVVNALTKTIVYNLNPRDNEMMASMVANFNDGITPGKMQYGAAWWFLDQKDGIQKQLDVLSNFGLLGRFVGMLTDSRSFLSFPRHEYFRRILCNILGEEVKKGELPDDLALIGDLVSKICSQNAVSYFNFNSNE